MTKLSLSIIVLISAMAFIVSGTINISAVGAASPICSVGNTLIYKEGNSVKGSFRAKCSRASDGFIKIAEQLDERGSLSSRTFKVPGDKKWRTYKITTNYKGCKWVFIAGSARERVTESGRGQFCLR